MKVSGGGASKELRYVDGFLWFVSGKFGKDDDAGLFFDVFF